MLTVTSLVAVGGTTLRPPRADHRLSALYGALAPAVFVAVEFVEYLTGVHEAPPAALLIIGCLVHAAIGVASTTLRAVCVDRAHRTAVAAYRGRRVGSSAPMVRAAARVWVSAYALGASGHPPGTDHDLRPVNPLGRALRRSLRQAVESAMPTAESGVHVDPVTDPAGELPDRTGRRCEPRRRCAPSGASCRSTTATSAAPCSTTSPATTT